MRERNAEAVCAALNLALVRDPAAGDAEDYGRIETSK